MRAPVIALLVLLSGCVASEPESPAQPTTGTPVPTSGAPTSSVPSAEPVPVGRAWTYEGTEFYNPETTFTVVVARADENGYLLAGGEEADIVYAALWGGRWYGEVGRDDVGLALHDGKSWEMRDGLTVTARAAEVATPKGTLPGFIVEGRGEGESRFRGEYAPEIGNYVKLDEIWRNGQVGQAIRMTSTTEDAKWVWYEPVEVARSGSAQEPITLDVASGYDNVIVSAGGVSGGRAFVEGPGGAQWSTEFTGEEEWRHAMLPATEGKWAATVAGRPFVEGAPDLPDPPIGWSHVSLAPVKWIRG